MLKCLIDWLQGRKYYVRLYGIYGERDVVRKEKFDEESISNEKYYAFQYFLRTRFGEEVTTSGRIFIGVSSYICTQEVAYVQLKGGQIFPFLKGDKIVSL